MAAQEPVFRIWDAHNDTIFTNLDPDNVKLLVREVDGSECYVMIRTSGMFMAKADFFRSGQIIYSKNIEKDALDRVFQNYDVKGFLDLVIKYEIVEPTPEPDPEPVPVAPSDDAMLLLAYLAAQMSPDPMPAAVTLARHRIINTHLRQLEDGRWIPKTHEKGD
jgi:hypothetical protein